MAKRRFKINAGGYGGEITIGVINAEFVEFMKNADEDTIISAIDAWANSGTMEEYNSNADGAPSLSKNGQKDLGRDWSSFDELEHLNSTYAEGNWTWSEVPNDGTDELLYSDEFEFEPVRIACREAYHTLELPEPDDYNTKEDIEEYLPVLVFHSAEKGNFGCYIVETDGEDFNPLLLGFSVLETNLCELVDKVWYNKMPITASHENYETEGKGYTVSVGYFSPKAHDTREKIYGNEALMKEMWEEFDAGFDEFE